MTKLAVIIINHHHGGMIKKTIESFFSLSYDDPVEVFVVNNVSDETTKSWLKNSFPDINIVENAEPKGFSENINHVIDQHPDFDDYLLLNPDVICLPGMVKTLMTVMENDPQVGVAGPALLNFDGSIQPSRRRFASFLVLVIRALHIDSIFKDLDIVNRYLMKDSQFGDLTEVNWITGAVMLLRKKALDQVGLFDPRFFLYFEDEDLCCRMWQKGWKVVYATTAKAYHAHIAAGRKNIFSKANFHHILSAVKMLIKYHGNITRCYDKGKDLNDS